MKYIRTKDGVYELTEWQCDLSGEMILVKANNKLGNDKIFARDIVKQADTIEELCDEFVFICKDFNKPQLVIPMNFDYCKKEFNYTEIYGAIWTDKGLIYVAKMNDKGELELL